jgi:NADH-quinone oxidoreductase subunit N
MNPTLVLQSVLDNLASWPMLLPEALVATTLVFILVLEFFFSRYQCYWLFPVAFTGIALAWCSKYWLGSQLALHRTLPLFNQLLVLDLLGVFFCLLLFSITLFFLFLSAIPQAHLPLKTAYVVLILGILLGSCLLIMAFHWLTIYLGLTLISLASAPLIGSQTTPSSAEASLKYLLYSMATTAVMLWGMSYFYGFTGTLALNHPNLEFFLRDVPGYMVLAVLLLCLSGILFVLAATPYHLWVPDVYQGAPAAAVAYLSTVPKLATVAILLRLFHQFLPQLGAELQVYVQYGIATLALLTIIVGNAAALSQNNLQRLMANAVIAQSGLLLAGIVASTNSQLGVLYYSAIYGVMGLAAWLGINILQHLTSGVHLHDFSGLGRQFPVLSSGITLVMLSLVGLPPTAGFIGKFLVFTALWEHMQRTSSFLSAALLVASLLSTVLSMYYYLKLPYVLFCRVPQVPISIMPKVNKVEQIILWCLVTLLLVGFFAAGNLLKVLGSWIDGANTGGFLEQLDYH